VRVSDRPDKWSFCPLEPDPGDVPPDREMVVENKRLVRADTTYWEESELAWDHKRECRVDGDAVAYDAARLYEYSRQGGRVIPIG
jgi:hypothetical protein